MDMYGYIYKFLMSADEKQSNGDKNIIITLIITNMIIIFDPFIIIYGNYICMFNSSLLLFTILLHILF